MGMKEERMAETELMDQGQQAAGDHSLCNGRLQDASRCSALPWISQIQLGKQNYPVMLTEKISLGN